MEEAYQGVYLTWADWTIMVIIAVSVSIGLWRGFVRESLSLLTWILSIVLALFFSSFVAQTYLHSIGTPALRILVAFALIFFGVLVAGTIIGKVTSSMVKQSGLGGVDRFVGVLFGVIRGVLVVAVLLAVAHLVHVDELPAMSNSILVPKFANMVEWLHNTIPTLIA